MMAIDQDDYIHISYYDDDLDYATNKPLANQIDEPAPGKRMKLANNMFSAENNENTYIFIDVEEPSYVYLAIMGFDGSIIREIANSDYSRGRLDFAWDGRDASGITVASGIYVAYLCMDNGYKEIHKICVIN